MSLEGRRVLFISYNGMLEPLGQSQVIPYLRELSRGAGVRFALLSYERAQAFEEEGRARCEALHRELAGDHIDWHRLRYHQRPSVPATFYDVMAGLRRASALVRAQQIEMVHARAHVPAAIALLLKKRFPLKMIFDVRGLMAEEYLDAEHWRAESLPFRLTKRMERRSLAAADGVVTLTEIIWPIIKEWEGLRGRADVAHEVVPCCVDLEKFRFDAETRAARRAELDFGDRFVLVYSGSIGGWYMTAAMVDFFVALLRERPDAHFLWLTRGQPLLIQTLMRERGIEERQYTVRAVASGEVASYLAAADAGVAFYKQGFSKLATSPVKLTEYLACGLPVVINRGVGDSDVLVSREEVGAVVEEFTDEEYARAAAHITRQSADAEQTRRRAREVAKRFFDLRDVGLAHYARLYQKVLG